LVLSTLAALAAALILLAGQGSRGPTPPSPGLGPDRLVPSRACVTARAAAQVTARSSIVITATAQAPVSVTEQATGGKGTATVTRTAVVSARVRATQPVAIRRAALASVRACESGESPRAAHTHALQEAYARALAQAHGRAERTASQGLRTLMRRLYPSVLAQARSRSAARAHELALAMQPSLAARAQARAAREAGG